MVRFQGFCPVTANLTPTTSRFPAYTVANLAKQNISVADPLYKGTQSLQKNPVLPPLVRTFALRFSLPRWVLFFAFPYAVLVFTTVSFVY